MASNLAEQTNKFPEETLMMRSNWDQRRKQEVSNLVDLTYSVDEKYGYAQSLLLKLRIQEGDPQFIKYKNPVSSKWSDPNFGALINDDRQKKIEMIREVPDLKEIYSPTRDLSHRNLFSDSRNLYATQSNNFSQVAKASTGLHKVPPKHQFSINTLIGDGSYTTGNKMMRKTTRCIESSRSATNLFKGEYSIDQDPVVK